MKDITNYIQCYHIDDYIVEKANFVVKNHITNQNPEINEDGTFNVAFLQQSLQSECADCKSVTIKRNTSWGDDTYDIRIDYLDEKDWPNHIAGNSIYLYFEFYNKTQIIEYKRGGHIELTQKDKEGDYKYLALKSFTDPYKKEGHNLMRKTKCTTPQKLIDTISKFTNAVYDAAVKDQGGKPLKRR